MSQILHLESNRKTAERQLWIVGGSDTHGVGVFSKERYGQIIADRIDISVSFLTKPRSSIEWAADQILRSDIREDDIVIWGLTGCGRFSFVDEKNNFYSITTNGYNMSNEFKLLVKENFLVSNHLLQDAITKIAQVTQTLDRLAIKYILGVFPLNDEQREKQFLQHVSQNKNSLLLYHHHGFIDRGSDNSHPGPKHHKWYADTILNFYNETK
jgi:hypothetical protein